jgi:endonuclease-3 related protein
MPTFVVDAYTRRVFGRIGIVDERSKYEQIRTQFEIELATPDVTTTVEAWQEAHALIVAHAKRFHTRTANLEADFLLRPASRAT